MTNVDHRRLAKELDRRRMRRRLATLLVLLAAAVAALLYLRCGSGFGTGGKGAGDGGKGIAKVPPSDAGPRRCALRLTARGLLLDGKPTTREAAIAACKKTTGADVLITGDARQGDWDALRGALEAASVQFFTREPRGVTPSDAGN